MLEGRPRGGLFVWWVSRLQRSGSPALPRLAGLGRDVDITIWAADDRPDGQGQLRLVLA